jgi:hypothetical protein
MTRADQLDAAEREAERRRLEHEIAMDAASRRAKLFLSASCRRHTGGWVTIKPNRASQLEADALRYLDLCGLLERDPEAPHIVRILEVTK